MWVVTHVVHRLRIIHSQGGTHLLFEAGRAQLENIPSLDQAVGVSSLAGIVARVKPSRVSALEYRPAFGAQLLYPGLSLDSRWCLGGDKKMGVCS